MKKTDTKVFRNHSKEKTFENSPLMRFMFQTPLFYKHKFPWKTYASIVSDIIECSIKSKE